MISRRTLLRGVAACAVAPLMPAVEARLLQPYQRQIAAAIEADILAMYELVSRTACVPMYLLMSPEAYEVLRKGK